jgi:hypothetical protein
LVLGRFSAEVEPAGAVTNGSGLTNGNELGRPIPRQQT